MRIITRFIALSTAAAAVLAAQPDIGEIEKQVEPPKEVLQKEQKELIKIGGAEYKPAMKAADTTEKIYVKTFKIEGNEHIEDEKLLKLLEPFKDKELSFEQLQEVASVITKEYREQGYFVSRAYLPMQDMKDDIVTLAVIEGNYGEFHLSNDSLVKESIVQAMLNNIKDADIVSTKTLERAMLIINDTPGAVITKADVMPGKDTGTSDFSIETKPSKRYSGYLLGDNYGSRYTSEYRAMGGLTVNSPLKIGDALSVSGLLGDKNNLENYRLGYSFPLYANGMRGEISYSKTDYALGKEYKDLDAKGYATNTEAVISYPVIRTRLENLTASLSYTSKDMKDEMSSAQTNKKSADVLSLSFDYIKNSTLAKKYNTQNSVNITFTSGDLSIEDATAKANDAAGAKTQGSYQKLLLKLGNTTVFSPKWSLESSFTYQQALNNKNLDGNEDLSIGGINGVKVYPDGEESGENGYILSAELFYNFPIYNQYSQKVSFFADTARVRQENNTASQNSRQLSDIGIGYHANYKDFFAKAYLAKVVGGSKVESEPNYHNRFLFQAGMVF